MPVILQGDSRNLAAVLSEAGIAVSSPPFVSTLGKGGETKGFHSYDGDEAYNRCKRDYVEPNSPGQLGAMPAGDAPGMVVASPPYADAKTHPSLGHPEQHCEGGDILNYCTTGARPGDERYGSTPGQLGAMPAGDAPGMCVASPPYASGTVHGDSGIDAAKLTGNTAGRNSQALTMDGYGSTPGNLGNMPPGCLVSSPPFGEGETRDRSPVQPGMVADCITRAYTQDRQGTTPGNLATMTVSSPPWENVEGANAGHKFADVEGTAERRAEGYATGRLRGHYASKQAIMAQLERENGYAYGTDPGNIGNQAGDTFWSAARTIVEQVYQVLRPGGHAVWVVKAFVRDGQIVDFPGQWQALCESCGFVTLHEHHAMLTEERGTQIGLDGNHNTKRVERKSFFRRLAESKGSPRIDYETVLCMVRP